MDELILMSLVLGTNIVDDIDKAFKQSGIKEGFPAQKDAE